MVRNPNDLTPIYQEVANILNSMIPEEWEEVLLYAEVREGFSQVYFYYYPLNSVEPVYSLDIDEVFDIDSSEFNAMDQNLDDCFRRLWEEFKMQDQAPWTYLTFMLDNTGQMKISYSYEDVSHLGPAEKRKSWIEKNLR
ncbi:immunity protein YezG family protein [Lentibacillus jeotgali]|uniref:immunity protein YezG family protein n=1 Tax=Lentibacillus jeotgali TaxID=558169 RepID=UPI0002626C67|nr:immunity protein YezG family protein [Lentibacillus jeotgali]